MTTRISLIEYLSGFYGKCWWNRENTISPKRYPKATATGIAILVISGFSRWVDESVSFGSSKYECGKDTD